jgi:hypothetical protein
MLVFSPAMAESSFPLRGMPMGPGAVRTEKGKTLAVMDPREEEKVKNVLRNGHQPECPRCGTPLQITPVPPRPDVSYVRDRVLLTCGPCDLTVAVDRK